MTDRSPPVMTNRDVILYCTIALNQIEQLRQQHGDSKPLRLLELSFQCQRLEADPRIRPSMTMIETLEILAENRPAASTKPMPRTDWILQTLRQAEGTVKRSQLLEAAETQGVDLGGHYLSQQLSRMCRQGVIQRVAHGSYRVAPPTEIVN